MKYFSLFSGIGGFENGIEKAWQSLQGAERRSIQPRRDKSLSEGRSNGEQETRGNRELQQPQNIGFSEIDKYAIRIYKKHFNHKEYGDVSKIKWNDVEDFEMLCGGFPCQAFSIAGKRGGFLDTRGTLFFEIARAAQEKQPRLLLLENVKGLLSHDKGRTFGIILNTLDELGYDLQWQVLNSKNFGVPQNRERVFIIGHLRGTSRPEVFPIGEDDSLHNEKNGTNKRPSQATTVRPDIGTKADGTYINTLTEATGNRAGSSKEFIRSVSHINKAIGKIRRLTPTECERLQGFPDGWTEGVSDTQRYKCLGNAVTVNVIEAIMEQILINLLIRNLG